MTGTNRATAQLAAFEIIFEEERISQWFDIRHLRNVESGFESAKFAPLSVGKENYGYDKCARISGSFTPAYIKNLF